MGQKKHKAWPENTVLGQHREENDETYKLTFWGQCGVGEKLQTYSTHSVEKREGGGGKEHSRWLGREAGARAVANLEIFLVLFLDNVFTFAVSVLSFWMSDSDSLILLGAWIFFWVCMCVIWLL